MRRQRLVVAAVLAMLVLSGVVWHTAGGEPGDAITARAAGPGGEGTPAARTGRAAPESPYANTGRGRLHPSTRDDRERLYVPNSDNDTVSVIDPDAAKVVDTFPVGDLPHHVTPSRDLATFYVNNTQANSLTPIDPETARPKGRPIPVDDPYNLYFTPDGRSAIVVAERLQRLDFRDPKTWKLQKSVRVGCLGVDHLDFSADGRRAVASCEFDGTLLLIDVGERKVIEELDLDHVAAKPVDVRISPD
ncbi:MAG: YncE family protein, partial [Thermoleophilaceae bacterium]